MIDTKVLLYICAISIVAIAIFLYGLKKFHLKYSLCLLSKKDKIISTGVIGVQYIVMMTLVLMAQPISGLYFAKIEMYYLFLFILSEILTAMAVRNLLLRWNKDVNLCYLLFVIALDFTVYMQVKNAYELVVGLLMSMLVYCLSVCVKESFTAKKIIYMVIVFAGVVITTVVWQVNCISVVYLVKNIVLAILMGICFTKVKRLRVEIKIAGFVIWVLLVVGLQLAICKLF